MPAADHDRLARFIVAHAPVLVLTGAGLSTASGLPDFRSPGGIWTILDPLVDGHVSMLERDPARVWRCWAEPLVAADLAPNPAHHAIAKLEALGVVRGVATQNIDGLHHAAGTRAIELHGHLRTAVCTDCGADEPMRAAFARFAADGEAPPCSWCGGVLRPPVVLFGEALPADALLEAEGMARAVSACLCVGTSLQVWPAAGLPEAVLARGGSLAIVSLEPTVFWEHAEIGSQAAAEDVLPRTVEAVRALLG